MGLSLLTLAMSQKYTNDSLAGVGAIKGSPCTIKEIVKENGINTITCLSRLSTIDILAFPIDWK